MVPSLSSHELLHWLCLALSPLFVHEVGAHQSVWGANASKAIEFLQDVKDQKGEGCLVSPRDERLEYEPMLFESRAIV